MSIWDEEIYCDRLGAIALFQCRTNTLRLKWWQGFAGAAMDCPLCGAVEETVAHFVTECAVLEEVREALSKLFTREGGAGWGNRWLRQFLLLLLLKKVSSARLGESDIHPISLKTPAPQYQPIDRKKREGKRVEDYSRDRAA